jgi:hypothetical protein
MRIAPGGVVEVRVDAESRTILGVHVYGAEGRPDDTGQWLLFRCSRCKEHICTADRYDTMCENTYVIEQIHREWSRHTTSGMCKPEPGLRPTRLIQDTKPKMLVKEQDLRRRRDVFRCSKCHATILESTDDFRDPQHLEWLKDELAARWKVHDCASGLEFETPKSAKIPKIRDRGRIRTIRFTGRLG